MRNCIGIKSQLSDCLSGAPVIRLIDRIGQQKLRLALRSITLDGHDDGGTNQNTVVFFLCYYKTAFFNSETFPQVSGHNNCPPLPHLGWLRHPHCLIVPFACKSGTAM
jgi:hypothetical protein